MIQNSNFVNTPQRIQRQRVRGFRTPPNTVYVGRPTIWGNPYKVGEMARNAAGAVEMYRHYITRTLSKNKRMKRQLVKLKGKNLACWCPLTQACHADVLLQIVNSD